MFPQRTGRLLRCQLDPDAQRLTEARRQVLEPIEGLGREPVPASRHDEQVVEVPHQSLTAADRAGQARALGPSDPSLHGVAVESAEQIIQGRAQVERVQPEDLGARQTGPRLLPLRPRTDLDVPPALLARLPPAHNPHWRPGHFLRGVPEGYRETLKHGRNVIADPDLARYWDDLALVTRAPLFSGARWGAIWRLNTGANDGLIHRERFLYPNVKRAPLADLATRRLDHERHVMKTPVQYQWVQPKPSPAENH